MPVLQLDPNSVQAGALPLIIVLGLLVVIGLGFVNMRSHMRKIVAPSEADLVEQAMREVERDDVASATSSTGSDPESATEVKN
jgi:hypothetical protein